jgi:hypothetical protein
MTPGTPTIASDITDYDMDSPRSGGDRSLSRPGNNVYQSSGHSLDMLEQIHPGSAVWHSVPMAAEEESQMAPLSADIDDVLTRLETIATTIETHLKQNGSDQVQETIRDWRSGQESEQPFAIAARYAVFHFVLKATLYETYAHRGDVPMAYEGLEQTFAVAADLTDNSAFDVESPFDDLLCHLPRDVPAEISWWRYGLLTTEAPAEDLGYLFEELIPVADRQHHGQFRTPNRISQVMRELATYDADRLLDAGMGAGALSVSRDDSTSVRVYGIEQSRTGFLLATTALALTDQPAVIHEADFFDIAPATLGLDPDASMSPGSKSRQIDIVPGTVDAAIGNPPYVANRNLERQTAHYRRHLHAFGDENCTPYADGAKRLSGRSDLFTYFVTHATQFLANGGRLVYLLPTKWMETEYGQTLQTFLFDHYQISAIIKFDESVFDDVQVNAVIVVAERCSDATVRSNTTTRFLTVHSELDPAEIDALITGDQAAPDDDGSTDRPGDQGPGYRIVTESQSVLAQRDTAAGPLTQSFQDAGTLQSLQETEQFVSLNTLATVTYGQKTGNNDLFLLADADLDMWPLANRFYTGALQDIGGVDRYHLTTSDSDTFMLDVHSYVAAVDERDSVVTPGASRTQQVIDSLARDGYDTLIAYLDQWIATPEGDATQGGDVWFNMGPLAAPDVVHPYRVYNEVRVFQNDADLIPTNCANGIDVRPSVDTVALLGYLNSTVHAAFLELWGQSGGGGSLEVTTGTLERLPVADVRAFSDAARDAVVTAYRAGTWRNECADLVGQSCSCCRQRRDGYCDAT